MYICVFGMGVGVWKGVRCPCLPVRIDILTPRRMFIKLITGQKAHGYGYGHGDDAMNDAEGKSNTYSNHVRPACLPRPDWDVRSRSDCWLAGWGYFKIEEYQGEDEGLMILTFACTCLHLVRCHIDAADHMHARQRSTVTVCIIEIV